MGWALMLILAALCVGVAFWFWLDNIDEGYRRVIDGEHRKASAAQRFGAGPSAGIDGDRAS
jgi:hypothetical protein